MCTFSCTFLFKKLAFIDLIFEIESDSKEEFSNSEIKETCMNTDDHTGLFLNSQSILTLYRRQDLNLHEPSGSPDFKSKDLPFEIATV